MNIAVSGKNATSLVFCRENVDPQVITHLLGLTPTEATRVGQRVKGLRGEDYTAHLGTWKLKLLGPDQDLTVEEQIGKWIGLLSPKASELADLVERGYRPYLDCQAESKSLSLCIDPKVLVQLGGLHIALSVWLYELPD